MSDSTDLWARRALSFGAVAREYDRLRPSPLPESVDWCVAPGGRRVLDLAAGTGRMTRALVEAGYDVVAVEPDPAMRDVLVERSPHVEALAGTGEAIPVADASVDAVVVASAWHWMDPERAVPEIARVLRSGGSFAAVWTTLDTQVPWVRALRDTEPGSAGPGGAGASGSTTERDRSHRLVELPPGSAFTDVATVELTTVREAPRDDVLGLLGTYSSAITAGPEAAAAARERAEQVLQQHLGDADPVGLPLRARCWRAMRTPR